MDLLFEDFSVGQVIEGAPVTISRDDMIAFAREFDAQPFHLDEDAAKATFVGQLIGSGWQTGSVGMRLLQRDVFRGQSSMGSVGVSQLRWIRPMLPGETIRLVAKVDMTKASASKPDRGFVRFAMTLLDARGEPVSTLDLTAIFRRRDVAPLPPRKVTLDTSPGLPEEPADAVALPFLRDAVIDEERDLGPCRFLLDDIRRFAAAYDPQNFHLDETAAAQSHFGAICASGWHTASNWMKRLHATRARDVALTARTGKVPQLGSSPGFKDMRFLAPIYAGDTVRYVSKLVDTRASSSRPGWGLATHYNTGHNQHGDLVFDFTGTVFWQWEPS